MVAVALTVSKSFSPPDIILNNLLPAILGASGNADAIITGTSSLPIRFASRFAERVHRSGVRLTLAIGSNIARTTLSTWNVIGSGTDTVTRSADWLSL